MATLDYLKNRSRWRVRWRATNRKNHYVFTGSRVFFEKFQAVAYFAEIEAQEKLVRSGEVSSTESIDTVAQNYNQYIKRHTKRTQQHYRMVMARFLATLPGSIARIQQIEAAHINEYLYQLRDQGLLNRTSNAHLTVIKSFCRFFSGRYKIVNPAADVKLMAEEPPNVRFLSPDEYKKVMEIATPLAKDRLLFLAHTGLRATEFYELRPQAVSPDMSTLTITGKGRKRRSIPLNHTAREILPRIKPATPNALLLQCYATAKKAKIPKFGPHSMRHWFATQLLLKGVPIALVSKMLGHASIRTTEQAYAHILRDDLANATDVLD